MRAKTILAFVVTLAIPLSFAALAGEQPKPANAGAESVAEAKAKADYDAAEKAAGEAEAAVGPLRAAMQKADTAYAEASKTANAKRQQATDAKNLAGEPGAAELKQAEANLPDATKALTDATNAKPALDRALADAKAAALPLQQAYDAAEKAAKEAEAAAKAAAEAANKLDDEAKRATAQATAKRRTADAAKAALARAQQNEQQATAKANTVPQQLAEAEKQKKAADEALAGPKNQVAVATAVHQAAEQAALAAEANAKVASEAEKQQAAADAAAKRKAADTAKTALTQAQQNEQQAQVRAAAAAQNLASAPAQKKAADDALAGAKNQVAAANGAFQAAEQAAQTAEAAAKAISGSAAKSPEEKKKALDDAAAKRKAADAAKTALAQAQQNEQQAQVQVNTAAKNLADAPAQKKAADDALAGAKNQAAAANGAFQAAEQAAQTAEAAAKAVAERAGRSEQQKQQAAADAAAKRKAADAAKAALAQAQAALQNPQKLANAAEQKLARATGQKKVADVALTGAKNQVAAATTALATAEQAAQEAEKAAEARNLAATQAAAKRKAAADAAAALVQAQQAEQQAQAQVTAAAQKLAAVPKPADADAQKKAADAALAAAKNQVAAATAANQAAREAAKEILQIDAANQQAAANAAAKRQAANAAKAALAPAAQKLEQAAVQANSAAQNLTRSEARKKSAEEGLANLKQRIAAAKQTHLADDQAAKAAEAAAVPLKAEAEKTRAAYTAAVKVADDKRTLAEQAKTALYRLVAARQVASFTESPDPPAPANRIDEIVLAKLKALGIQPVLCSDAVFVRRAYLDLTGKLPSADEAKAFIQNPDKAKRAALINQLLDQPAHFDYWAMKWGDILRVKAEFPVKVWPNAAQAYYRWLWEAVAQNKPYDQFARELLTSSGSNFRVGPVNFYRAIQDKTPEGIASVVGLAFMGTRVVFWPQDRRAGMAAFFSQVGYKPTSEWKEEIVFWDPLKSIAVPGSTAPGVDAVAKAVTATNQVPEALAQPLSENGPLAAVFPDGTKVTIPPDRDPREVFADWLIRPENPWFARNIANRTWAWVMGRGIIHEPDNVRDDNPPSNPELLAYLEKELVASRYDLKHLKRLIFTSTTYQFSSVPRFKGPEARANFASYLLRRVEAEVLIDALNEITGSSDLYTSAVPEPFTYIPHDMTAVALADGSITSSFLTLFGRSSRSTGMETERVNELASTQWLHMLNSAAVQNKLQGGPKLNALLASGGKTNEIAERLYLTILSRFPTDADMKTVEEYAKAGVTRGRDMWIDLTWALINSPEFLLRH